MGMPQIPDGKNRPCFDDTMIDLLESVALEEMALSHIMNAEGEKLQEVIRQYGEDGIGFCQLESACKSAQGMVNSVIMKEWLLLNKLNIIMEVKSSMDPMPPCGEPSQGRGEYQTGCKDRSCDYDGESSNYNRDCDNNRGREYNRDCDNSRGCEYNRDCDNNKQCDYRGYNNSGECHNRNCNNRSCNNNRRYSDNRDESSGYTEHTSNYNKCRNNGFNYGRR